MTGLLSSILPSSTSHGGSHLTDAPLVAHFEIGPAAHHLKQEILKLYWAGVRRELPYILITLRQWQSQTEYASTILDDEVDQFIHGYDTFLDQVSHSSRRFSQRQAVSEERNTDGLPSYNAALQDRGWDYFSEMKSNEVKQAIRLSLDSREGQDILRRRARMLLQSLQLLDMDKMIEYRDTEKYSTSWKRPSAPQLTATSFGEGHLPVFTPQLCSTCSFTICGSVFTNIKDESIAVCESCYREHHYGHTEYTKNYKACCLAKVVTPETSRKICHCSSVRRRDNNGRLAPLWPIGNESDCHLKGGMGKLGCGLFDLTDMVAEAKYAATRGKADRDTTLEDVKRSEAASIKTSVPELGDSSKDIPIYARSTTNKQPYGNVHMALRLGPIIIENGVQNTRDGVLITNRDPPQLQVLRDSKPDGEYSLLLAGEKERTLYSQHYHRVPKRYKAMMKQVVGGTFCGLFDQGVENALVDAIINASLQLVDEGISEEEEAALMERTTKPILETLRDYLSPRLEVYIDSIVNRLLDPRVDLRWDFRSNNCQAFCDSIIDWRIFGSMFAPHGAVAQKAGKSFPDPLYLMSFVCRPGAYIKEKTKSKFDVPNGLIEEYLLKYQYGRHEESDIIDTLAEYWHDWGGFEGPIYRYQDVFPWDCTEAYGRYPVTCSECNISKHVLAFPFDSWSILSLHLARGRQLYPKRPNGRGVGLGPLSSSSADRMFPSGHMSDSEWFYNRLTVLLAQDTLLTTAVAMARCGPFRESTLWLHMQADERQDRLKLGGIHRAQPFSHHFEKGAYHQYFVADWVSLALPLRIQAYENLRNWRATRTDMRNYEDESRGGGGGGCGGFACGVLAVGCVAGCEATGGDTCGAGCVTSCGGGGGGGNCGGGGCGGGGGGGCGGCGGGGCGG